MCTNIYRTIVFVITLAIFDYGTLLGQVSSSQNFVMVNTVKQPGITTEALVQGLLIDVQGKGQSVAYFDGLGRPLQTVVTSGGASKKDLVTGNEYDQYGREVTKYLPFAQVSNTNGAGAYQSAWKTTQSSFYNGALQGVDADAAPYSQSVVEASPLNRVLAQGAPGAAWQPNLANPYDASKNTVRITYKINTAADNIRIFGVDSSGNISSPGFYTAGQLNVKSTVDEDSGLVKEYSDMTGHMILKQVFSGYDIMQTYYIYDDLDQLKGVIQPEGVAALPATGTWTPDAAFKANWMFLYSYDNRNRMISKQVPGSGPVYMLYDQWDRLVLTQDSALRVANKWLFTKYDALSRPIVIGLFTSATTLATMTANVMASSGQFETINTAANEGYTLTGSFPSSASYALTILSTTHYDSYGNLPAAWASGYSFVSENGVTSYNTNLTGQVVGTQTAVLGTSNWLRSVSYYDDKYRLVQATADNTAGGKDRITRLLTWDGKVTTDWQSHSSNVYTTALVVKKNYTYDHADRLLKVTHQIGSGEVVTLIENSYNELGQLLNKKLHQAASYPNNSQLQKLDYSYNIRGWLNSVNKPDQASTGYDESDLFNFELHYNNAALSATPRFNGNIAEQVWKGGYDEYYRGYKYSYDKANRLMTSDYGFKYLNAANSMTWDFSMKYNENITMLNGNNQTVPAYDKNGNIKHLERFHGSWTRVDALDYEYRDWNQSGGPATGNRLGRVNDAVFGSVPVGFKDVGNGGSDYTYDGNGNLKSDLNKGITNINYNHLNLPILVDFGAAKGKIEYLYDAGGNKMQKTVTDMSVSPNKITITKYAGAFVYTNSYLANASPIPTETLEFIAHEEGRIRPIKIDTTQALTAVNTRYIYDYFMKDHLGNTRMVLTTQSQTDFYAATAEPANAAKEAQLFSAYNTTTKPAGFDGRGYNTAVTVVNGGTAAGRMGPGIVLKVMAGDTVTIGTRAWYNTPTQSPVAGLPALKDQLLTLLTNGIIGANGTHGGAVPTSDINTGSSGVLDYLLGNQTYDNSRPKAYLNWVIVDDEFKQVTSSFHMGAVQVPVITDSAKQLVGPSSMTVRRNGWLYVYVSNESNQNVYFDDLSINHKRGPVVENTNYYAFGLEIPGLSSKAIGFGEKSMNRVKFNGKEVQSKEFTDGSGLEWEDFGARMYDNQVARWMAIDELAEQYFNYSPYEFGLNDPIGKIDADGRDVIVVRTGPKPASNGEIRRETGNPGSTFTDPRTYKRNGTFVFGSTSILNPEHKQNYGVTYALNKEKGKYDVSLSVAEYLHPDLAEGGYLDNKNPGFREEVAAHEEGHGDQIDEAFKATMTISVGVKNDKGKWLDNKALTFSGRIDDILDQASAKYDELKSSKSKSIKGISKEDFINKVFFVAVGTAIDKATVNKEDNADKRAEKKLGHDLKYKPLETTVNY